jgi:hypothetical protein
LSELLRRDNKFYDDEDLLVARALQDPTVKNVIYKHMKSDDIKLVHKDSKEPIYKRETSLIGEKGDRALNESPTHED